MESYLSAAVRLVTKRKFAHQTLTRNVEQRLFDKSQELPPVKVLATEDSGRYHLSDLFTRLFPETDAGLDHRQQRCAAAEKIPEFGRIMAAQYPLLLEAILVNDLQYVDSASYTQAPTKAAAPLLQRKKDLSNLQSTLWLVDKCPMQDFKQKFNAPDALDDALENVTNSICARGITPYDKCDVVARLRMEVEMAEHDIQVEHQRTRYTPLSIVMQDVEATPIPSALAEYKPKPPITAANTRRFHGANPQASAPSMSFADAVLTYGICSNDTWACQKHLTSFWSIQNFRSDCTKIAEISVSTNMLNGAYTLLGLLFASGEGCQLGFRHVPALLYVLENP